MDFLGGLTISGGVSIVPPSAPPASTYTLYSWGNQSFFDGNLGLGAITDPRSSPVQLGGTGEWTTVASSMAIKTNGTLWTWGENLAGEAGINLKSDSEGGPILSSPVQVGSGTNWSKLYPIFTTDFAGGQRFAITTDNKLFAWGDNGGGSLGLNNTIARSSPTQVGTDSWSSISVGFNTNGSRLGIKADGTLWAWGANDAGQLGLNNRVSNSSPTQVGADTNWKMVASGNRVGGRFTIAVKTDGTLWSWGENANRMLGLNNSISRSSPTQVGSGTDWSYVAVATETSAAIKTDGTLWIWGANNGGAIGLNSAIDRSSPVQVGTDTNWGIVSGNQSHFVARKTNNTLWVWGSNSDGQLGLNNTIYRSSPTQVGSATDWNTVATSGPATFGTRLAS